VPSTGTLDVNGERIRARDGASIKDVDVVSIKAIEVFVVCQRSEGDPGPGNAPKTAQENR
jgi:hypothetical protein